jgi:hypothetical protein
MSNNTLFNFFNCSVCGRFSISHFDLIFLAALYTLYIFMYFFRISHFWEDFQVTAIRSDRYIQIYLQPHTLEIVKRGQYFLIYSVLF